MAFNSHTYRANQSRKQAVDYMAEAREIKARVEAGTAYDWERPRVAHLARLAILSARLARSFEELAQIRKAWRR